MDANLDFSVEKADGAGFVVLLIEELEIDVSEVDHQKVDAVFAVLFKLFEHLLLIFLLGVHLALTEVKLPVEISWQILYFFNLSSHPDLHYQQLIFLDKQIRMVGVKQFEGERYLVLLNILAAMRVEVVYFFLEFR